MPRHERVRLSRLYESEHDVGRILTMAIDRTISPDDEAVAELSICGGMPGSVNECKGAPKTTTGQSGSAQFMVTALDDDATISVSKERWMRCVRAARAACPTGSFSATCLGGGSTGDVVFTLESTKLSEL